jgi:hypothetical protein
MPKHASPLVALLPAAHYLAIDGRISPAGLRAYHTTSTVAAALPLAARAAAVRAALARLAEDDLAAALHGLAAAIRAETEAAIQTTAPLATTRVP